MPKIFLPTPLRPFAGDASTVGGMVIEALGHLPAPGELIAIGPHEFEVEHVADRAVESVIVSRAQAGPDESRP